MTDRNKTVRKIREVQHVVRWEERNRRKEWRDHVNIMTYDRLAKIAKENDRTHPDRLRDGMKTGLRHPNCF